MAYMNDEIPRNPMDKVERPKPRKDEARKVDVEAYTEEETAYILECLEKEPLKWRVLMELMIDTGIRRGECCGLKWSNVDFQSNTITIEHNLCYTPEKGVYLDTPKNGKVRNINVAPEVMGLLKQLRTNEGVIKFSPYVFTQDGTTEPMHPQSPTRYMQKFSAKYGIPELHPHKLRHTFASVCITNGADPASVSEIMGHSDVAVTFRMYVHPNKEKLKTTSNIFQEAIKRKQA
jgi:integrase